jgi:hypothetical protein
MRNVIEQLDSLNHYKKVILWDRFLTDAVYSEDEQYAAEILRVMKSHKQKAVIYIKPNNEVIKLRKSKEGANWDDHKARYEKVIKSFNTHEIELREEEEFFITERILEEMHSFIQQLVDKA